MDKNDRKKDFTKVNEHGHVVYVHKKHKKEIKENTNIIINLIED